MLGSLARGQRFFVTMDREVNRSAQIALCKYQLVPPQRLTDDRRSLTLFGFCEKSCIFIALSSLIWLQILVLCLQRRIGPSTSVLNSVPSKIYSILTASTI